ncbi:HAMP domain-containing histidine kinase [Luteibacter anthropi]|uniref:histidine kinase n=1 Tax=Luteibacter anthropi TaxID=564369 RepID=A0A7X5UA91_9GAMM|nr:HAMP domain-containing sensor histidine kinase [Luteibacter anthropi]NII06734.1 HAMP domain-containing histidine kinase [Luteibacter anthropi]URX61586.1 HAMP domain-containing histidine kinase [Luteibacter anthropi]
MAARSRSLTTQLAWRLVVLQVVILIATIAAIVWSISQPRTSFIDEDVARTVARSLDVEDGQLVFHPTSAMQDYLDEAPTLWFHAVDDRGHVITHGTVPEVYRPLAASLRLLEASEVHANNRPLELTMRIYTEDSPDGRLRLIVGGGPLLGVGMLFVKVAFWLSWRIGLPLVLVTLIAVPWIIHRSMAGVGKVAEQAEAIDIDQRGARLEDGAVPGELQPLVRTFNATLERLGEGYEARDRFLADAAHELRAPIAILETRLESLPQGETRTRLLTDLGRLSNLAEQLLDLQRLGKHETELLPTDLVSLARGVSADIAPLVIDAGYELAMDAPERPVVILGDSQSLSRALTNLIQNAIVHAGGKGLIHVQVTPDGAFEIADQGPGIPLEQRAQVFTPFYRVRPSSVGTGLGLHLVSEIVARHGGEVRVTDAPGGGARFRIQLRLA